MVGRQPAVRGFELADYIGRGGFSTVYSATQPRLNRVVAIKVIDADLQVDEDARRRFERECQTMGSLTGHHAVVTVHEVGECVDGQPYIAMELLEGGSLQDRLDANGPLSWPEVAAIGSQIAEALGAAHELGILHRDVKPANIMRDRFGHHKLGDFGIAGLAASAQTTAGAAPATVAYAAPEVLLGKRATTASDIYGLGATLYALLTGGPAFAADTDESVVPMVMRITRDPLPELAENVAPPQFNALVTSMMAKGPADRPADASAVVSALRQIEAAHLLGETRAKAPATTPSTSAAAHLPAITEPATRVAPTAVMGTETTDELTDVTVLRVPKDTAPVPAETNAVGSGAAPHLGRRVAAIAVDLLLLAALLSMLAAIVFPLSEPRANLHLTVEGDRTLSAEHGRLRAHDFGTTLTVTNATDRTIRVALSPHWGETQGALPPGGATLAPRQHRRFAVPRLEEMPYDVAYLNSNGDVVATFDGSDGAGMVDVVEPSPPGAGALVVDGFIVAVLILAVGWPIVAVPGIAAAIVFLSNTERLFTATTAGFLLGALVLSFILEAAVRAVRQASFGESIARIEVAVPVGRASFGRLMVRWLAKPLSALPFFAGYWLPKIQTDHRTWHDRLAGVVFRTKASS